MKTGPRSKPPLQVVREGNPGRRPVREGVKAPLVEDLPEPDWLELFPRRSKPKKPARPKNAGEDELIGWYMKLADWQRQINAIEGSDRCRESAMLEWRRVVPILVRTAGLADVDRSIIIDYCVIQARLWECERRLSVEGLIVMGQRGECRNPLTTVATQYRTQLKAYIGELGLSPSSRGQMTPPGDDDDDGDPFD